MISKIKLCLSVIPTSKFPISSTVFFLYSCHAAHVFVSRIALEFVKGGLPFSPGKFFFFSFVSKIHQASQEYAHSGAKLIKQHIVS